LVTLWGNEFIDKYSWIKAGSVVGIKNAKVSNFGGKSLNLSNNSQVYTDALITSALRASTSGTTTDVTRPAIATSSRL